MEQDINHYWYMDERGYWWDIVEYINDFSYKDDLEWHNLDEMDLDREDEVGKTDKEWLDIFLSS